MRTFIDRFIKPAHLRSETLWALAVLAVGLFLSVAGFLELQTITKQRLFLETEKHIRSQVEQIQTHLNISLDSLTNVGELYRAAGDISTAQLKQVFDTKTHYHTGILGLAWVPEITKLQVGEFEKRVQAEGNSLFHIFELSGHGLPRAVKQHDGDVYFPVRATFPRLGSDLRPGLNLASIPSRLNVMNKAKVMRKTLLIQRISIFNRGRHLYGFQAYHPLFVERQGNTAKFAGYVVGVYDFQTLLGSVFSAKEATVTLLDSGSSSKQLLFSSAAKFSNVNQVNASKAFHWTFPIIVADKQWILSVFPNTATQTLSNSMIPYIGLLAGGLITLMLTLYLFISLLRSRQLVELSSDLAGTSSQLDIQRELKQEADRASQAKSILLQAASHDLRQPLHTIGLLTGLLKDSDDPQQQRQLADKVLLAVDSMNKLFGALLDLSLLESGQTLVKAKTFMVNDLLTVLSSEYQIQAENKGLDFRYVPSTACVYTDYSLLERMLRNLLSNALRYTNQGKVLLGCRRLKNGLRICVADTGIGMSEAVQGRVTEEFYRDEQARKMVDNGLGLGLSIVSKTAKALGLPFGFFSTQGQGSVFYIDVIYGAPALINSSQPVAENEHILGRRVWVFEDGSRFALEQLLSKWGCQWVSVDSASALDAVLQQNPLLKPDLIIADYQLVNETGLELVARTRHFFQQTIPVLMVTGAVDMETRNEIDKAGHALLLKPVKPKDLYHWLQTH